MVCSTPGFPVLHCLPELAQTHVHRAGDVIQPSHPSLSLLFLPSIFPSIRVFSNESSLRIRRPKYWSFSISPYSGLISFIINWLISLLSKGLSRIFANITVQKHQFFSAQPFLWSISHICTWLLEKNSFGYADLCWWNNVSAFKYTLQVCHSFSSESKHNN